MSWFEISGEILADFSFLGTFSVEFPNFAPIVLNFLQFPFSNPRARRVGDKSVPLSASFISIELLPKLGDLSVGFTFPALPGLVKMPWLAGGWNELFKVPPNPNFLWFWQNIPSFTLFLPFSMISLPGLNCPES